MKKIFRAGLLLGVLLTTSECKNDFLQLQNPNAITDQSFYQTEADALRATNAVYSSLQRLPLYSTNLLYTYDLRADDYKGTKNLPGYAPFPGIANFTLNASNGFVLGHWEALYEGVFRCNIALEKIPGISMDETRKRQALGEARFMRAFYYMHLVSLFGDVPLIVAVPKSEADYRPSRTPKADVYAQIIADLTEAKNALPTPAAWGAAQLGRATKGAAQGFLGKMYLTLGRYADAKRELAELVASNTYDLVPDYYSNFTEENENNAESLFEIQYKSTPGNVWGSGDATGDSEGSLVALMYGNPQGGAFYNAQPSLDLVQEFEAQDVVRRNGTAYHPGGVVYDPAGKNEPWEKSNPPNTFGNRKYFKNEPDPNLYASGINIRVLRYADVLLLYAEALNETDGPAAALPPINRVRARAGLPACPTASYPASTKAEVFALVMHERMVELGGEQHRWEDLVRWDNNGKIDMTPYIKTPKDPDNQRPAFNKAVHKVLPIPQQERDTNPNLTQNTGY